MLCLFIICRTADAEEIFAIVLDLVVHLVDMSPEERIAFVNSPDMHLIKLTLQNCRRDCKYMSETSCVFVT